MVSVTIEKDIDAPVEAVFDRATDFAKAPESIRGIARVEVLTEGPVGVGTRFRETRKFMKREATEEMEVVAFDRPSTYALGCESHGCRYHTEFRLTPRGSGTRLAMVFRCEPQTLVAKVLGLVFRPMMKMVAKECGKDLDDLKASIEGGGNSLVD